METLIQRRKVETDIQDSLLIDRIEAYWTDRAPSYDADVSERMGQAPSNAYRDAIDEALPELSAGARVLDVGCGPGFFPRLLAGRGLRITCIDCTDAMLETARRSVAPLGEDVEFLNMDAQDLTFADETFDLVVSRNVTWTLEHPELAYREWMRVLRPGGAIVNFDANWYGFLVDDDMRIAHETDRINSAHEQLDDPYVFTDTAEMEAIAAQLPLTRHNRPVWDAAVLLDIGCSRLHVDCDFWRRGWNEEEKVVNASTPAFLIIAGK